MIKVGVLGTGFGKVHTKILSKISDVEIKGVFGKNIEKLNEIRNELGVYVTTDINELILDSSIDLIDICLPTKLHKKYIIESLKNGKHVLCETPVTYSVKEAEEIREYAMKYNKLVFVDLFYKFSAPHRFACEKIKSKDLGKPVSVTAYNRTPAIWGDLGMENIIMNFMIHNFDFVTEILGDPKMTMANGVGDIAKAHVNAMLEFENGFSVIESSSMMPNGFPFSIGFNVICEHGAITYNAQFSKQTTENLVLYQNDNTKENIELDSIDEYEEVIKHVIECVVNNTVSTYFSIDEAIKSLEIAEAVRDSFKYKKPVKRKESM